MPCCTFRQCDVELSYPKHDTFIHAYMVYMVIMKNGYVCDGGENENNGLRNSSHLKILEPSQHNRTNRCLV